MAAGRTTSGSGSRSRTAAPGRRRPAAYRGVRPRTRQVALLDGVLASGPVTDDGGRKIWRVRARPPAGKERDGR
ncbi:hypothetical protein ACIO1C_23680 [Streptomyces sp. NPDC087420]|uniref:hypothetical protein n=1 Tax=Streptomyces sp. NPDC087420 TaxID=3365785 RepID=UPI0038342591